MNIKALVAEVIGTFWLVFAGLGTALFASGFVTSNGDGLTVQPGVGWVGVSLAFAFLIITMAYAIGHISGCHLNPAVTLGLVAGGRFDAKDAPGYIGAQIVGGIIGALLLVVIGSSLDGFDLSGASNGFGDNSPLGYGLGAVFLIEAVLTFIFLFVIMGATSSKAPAGFAPLAIGFCLALIHLISIPVSNTSVNPARSLATALFDGQGWSLEQLWVFIVAPIVGGILGGITYRWINSD